ncbi:hypothetical protein [Rhodovulum sp.]|uniref:hypothetical protein n=1 Tax=Rhodovulum sp. TaxID=34009 RepID=UPI00257D5C7A|nr:hypothetical protein [Rhodovulum sp.]
MKRLIALACLALAPAPALADEVVDTLNSAIAAYEAGDVKYALEELAYARQKMQAVAA